MTTSHHSPVLLPLPDGLVRCNDGLVRPTWASHDELIRDYYDHEWGLPVHDEVGVFERLVLEGFQAGLSWRTVLASATHFVLLFEVSSLIVSQRSRTQTSSVSSLSRALFATAGR